MSAMMLICAAFSLGALAPQGQIAYVRGNEQEDLCVMVMDIASGSVEAVGTGRRDETPVWSPDGSWLAFTAQGENGIDIHLVQPETGQRVAIKHRESWNREPRWSPDGRRLAYSVGEGMTRKIAVCDTATGEEAIWPREMNEAAGLCRPVWTDSSTLITIGFVQEGRALSTDAFSVTEEKATRLTMSQQPLKPYAEWAIEPAPNGTDYAFDSNDGGDREVFVLSLRRMTLMDVSNHREADWNPRWAPDGNWVAFESFRGSSRGIYRVSPERLLVFPVAASADSANWAPAWSPDGSWIAFVSTRTGNPEIFVTHVADGSLLQVTRHPGLNLAPAWRPTATP